jgi:hypothetical protein
VSREIITEVGYAAPFVSRAPSFTTWWERYSALGLHSLSETAREVIEADSRLIVRDCIPGPSRTERWPETRVRTGVIVGAVQSGKTASMLALAALLLDEGTDILVILAGTRVALWRQTYERLLKQLDGSTPESAVNRWSARLLVPQPAALRQGAERATPAASMRSAAPMIEDALGRRRPVILVIPKVDAHLLAASRTLQERIARVLPKIKRPVHMVVMDDEADDASVLDATDSKTIPRRIEMLWADKERSETSQSDLFATYVAYTATPQANFLQQSHNPLSPRSFCAALRTPYKNGAPSGPCRHATFVEPEGVTRFYCGGELFYNERFTASDAAFCRATRYPSELDAATPEHQARRVRAASDRMLIDGLRAYLVAAAVRAMQAQRAGKLLPSEIPVELTPTEKARLPQPTCMLVHPSARQDLHLDEARRLVLLSSGADPDDPEQSAHLRDREDLALDVGAIRASLEYPALWRPHFDSYQATLREMSTWPGAGDLYLPPPEKWSDVAATLSEHVLPYVRLRIINSDPASDDRPQFDLQDLGNGQVGPPLDLLTIFVSGNVMSRGITIEGLTTTVFTRPASEPAADTQMQMQRWFGYRGSHVHLCRVLAYDDQIQLFRMYHEHDTAMRSEILASMDRGELEAPSLVLQGPRSLATAKIPSRRLPLHPGATPSVRLIEADDRDSAASNANLLATALDDGEWKDVGPAAKPRGRLRMKPVSLATVADLLDRLRYASYDPGCLTDARFTRWAALEDQLGLLKTERPLFRPPRRLAQSVELEPDGCPYSIAAYFRLWNAALKRARCDGLYPSDREGTPWALEQPMMKSPVFYIGLAYGDQGASRCEVLRERGVIAMTRGEAQGVPRRLNTLWGRRGEGGKYHGDQLFDYNHHNAVPPALLGGVPVWRPRGHPGLLLFHVVRSEKLDAVTVGLAIPHGGPEQFAALPALSQRGT